MSTLWGQKLLVKKNSLTILETERIEFLKGQVTVVLGENGAGKSTLLSCLSGVVAPNEGKVFWGNVNVLKMASLSRARLISSTSQQNYTPADLTVSARIFQGLSPAIGFQQLPTPHHIQMIYEIACELHIEGLLDRKLDTLSGGEKRRTQIAKCLINERASVYCLDEPDAGLDYQHKELLVSILRKRASFAKVVVLSLHDLYLAKKIADRAILLKKGKVVKQGQPEDILSKANLEELFFK